MGGGGDLDADGYDDLVVGAYGDDAGAADAGAVYVFRGSSVGLDAGSAARLVASDAAPADYFGTAVLFPGDLDGDGFDDLAVAAYCGDAVAAETGSFYVFLGSPIWTPSSRTRRRVVGSSVGAHDVPPGPPRPSRRPIGPPSASRSRRPPRAGGRRSARRERGPPGALGAHRGVALRRAADAR